MCSVFPRWELLVCVMTSSWSQTPYLNQQSVRTGYVQEPGIASVRALIVSRSTWMSPMLVTANERFPLFTWSFLFGSEPLFRYGAIFFFFRAYKPSLHPWFLQLGWNHQSSPLFSQFSDQPTHSELHSVDWLRRIKQLATRSIIGYALTWSGSECIDPLECANPNICYKTMIKHWLQAEIKRDTFNKSKTNI